MVELNESMAKAGISKVPMIDTPHASLVMFISLSIGPTHSLTNSVTHSLTYSVTHSLTNSSHSLAHILNSLTALIVVWMLLNWNRKSTNKNANHA